MPVIRLDLSYDGTGFRGYAKQNGQRTVQGDLEDAIGEVLGQTVTTAVAGRTDAGVHARGQVVSFHAQSPIDPDRLIRSLNAILGGEVVVSSADEVDETFHARFSAKSRTYRYMVSLARTPNPMMRHMVWHVGSSVDWDLMQDAARAFVGEHDFSSFCRSVQGKSNVRNVRRAEWLNAGANGEFWIEANAFCHQMVRSLVGLCYDVGRGHIEPAVVSTVIDRADRSSTVTVAPPHGLTLWKVEY